MAGNPAEHSDRLAFIDTWRAIAVSLVILAHLATNHEWKLRIDTSSMLKFLASHGETGVFIFFFISGYVVSKACLNEIARTGDFSTSGFYIRRVFRIVPPLMFYLVTCITLAQLGAVTFSAHQFALSALYLCNNRLADCGWLGGHIWSPSLSL